MKHFILGCILGGILATAGGLLAQYDNPTSPYYNPYLQQNRQQEILNELRRNNMIQQQRNNQQLLNPC